MHYCVIHSFSFHLHWDLFFSAVRLWKISELMLSLGGLVNLIFIFFEFA